MEGIEQVTQKASDEEDCTGTHGLTTAWVGLNQLLRARNEFVLHFLIQPI
jgi:hypothetical protein